jgi:TonB family protein
LAVSGIKLSGVSEKGSKSWSNDPIAVGIHLSTGCVEYRFLDTKGSFSISQTINGQTVGVDIKDGKLAVTSGIPLPLCLVFPVSDSSHRKMLAFSGTEAWFEDNGARPLPISKYSVFVDEKTMTARRISHPEPEYPALARVARIQGTVVLSVTIAADGRVADVQVFSQDNPLLLTGVVETIKTWQYQPISSSSVPVEVRTRATVTLSQ